jgi:hypothetical protein
MGSLRNIKSEGFADQKLKSSIHCRCHKIIEDLYFKQDKKLSAAIFLRHCCCNIKISDAQKVIEKRQWNLHLGKISDSEIIENLRNRNYDIANLETLRRIWVTKPLD